MKRLIICMLIAVICPLAASAQNSTMTDEQVMSYILKEHEAGRTQQEIATRLLQRGIDIQQVQRVRKKMERLQKQQGLGTADEEFGVQNGEDRLRQNNSQEKTDPNGNLSSQRMQKPKTKRHTYDEDDDEYMMMLESMDGIMPVDSIAWLEQILDEQNKEKRKVFGHDLFNIQNLTFEPNMNIATPKDYLLGPGDAVIVDIYGASQKSLDATISPDGEIVIEGVGPITVAGLTVDQANARLRSKLGARYGGSQVKLSVGQTRTILVNVAGDVVVPGTYTLSAFSTVYNALYMAGGPSELGTLRNIKVYRNGRLISTVDVYDYLLNGKLSGDIRLADNDQIVVGTYDCLVNITGKVKRPMFYEMKRDESIGSLIDFAGGFTGDAYKKSVRVVRKTGREYSVYNVGEFDMGSFHVADGDSVSVDSILERFENMVELKGAVFRPGMYQVGGNIASVRALLEAAEGVTEEAFTAHAVMHRMKEDRTLKVIPVDVDGIMKGDSPDIALQPNDVLFIPTKQEMMQDQTITIHGEVQYPGIYKYADDETIEDFILQAGGLKETASTVKVDVSRRIMNPQALTTDTVIARTYTFALKEGFVIDGEPGFTLMPFDEVYVRQSPGYYKQQNVSVEGEVMFSGTYTLSRKNMRLSDLIREAGGVNDRAFVSGARLERKYTQEERLRAEAAKKKALEEMETNLQEQASRMGNINMSTLSSSQQMKKYEIGDSYPVGIELDKALNNPGSNDDIVLREGDRLIVPQYEATVKINGEVLYPNTVGYVKGKGVNYYIDQAGGFSSKAKKSQTYIIYMNGMVSKVGHSAKVMPGCEIVVPAKSVAKMTTAERMSMATSAGSFAAIIATIANIIL
ncbi:MAG: SLBB domain-containing protein [Prevotella sp.]|nr:SLBB domain-containing protein [Prevotella sp.]